MELEKKDIAKALGLEFVRCSINTNMFQHVLQFNFTFRGENICTWEAANIEEAWDVVSDKVLRDL